MGDIGFVQAALTWPDPAPLRRTPAPPPMERADVRDASMNLNSGGHWAAILGGLRPAQFG